MPLGTDCEDCVETEAMADLMRPGQVEPCETCLGRAHKEDCWDCRACMGYPHFDNEDGVE